MLEAKWGLIPDMSGMRSLTEVVGMDTAKLLTMTGDTFSGQEAKDLGLATMVADDPMAAADELIARLVHPLPGRHRRRQADLRGDLGDVGPQGVLPRAHRAARPAGQREHQGRPRGRVQAGEAGLQRPEALTPSHPRAGPTAGLRARAFVTLADMTTSPAPDLLDPRPRLGGRGPRRADPGRARGARSPSREQDPGSAAAADLAERFSGTLEFGTAGLRGALGAGPMRMNRVVVTRAAAGLAAYLRAEGAVAGRRVVIGYDARHNSDVFARDTAEVMTGAGLRALLLPRPLPTPLLAFAIRHLGCVAGVMVTASHNPPAGQRLQGLPRRRQPDRAAGRHRYRRAGSRRSDPSPRSPAETAARCSARRSSRRTSTRSASLVPADAPRDLSLVYTPMHGVGGTSVVEALRRAGFAEPHVVEAQADPDPEFPTVAFPNPEEPGAMDLAVALAEKVGADVLVANDPDADRCAVGVPGPQGWRMLRGDEVGALLGDFLLRSGKEGTYAASIVSSSLLGRMAAAHGRPYEETLTGFKWIGRIPGLAFGYEEALGYCVDPARVRDKDGVSALLLVAQLAAELKAEGRGLVDRLDEIAARVRRARHRPAQRPRHRPVPDRRGDGAGFAPSPRPRSAGSRWSRSRTSPRAATRCRPPTVCATGWPREPG